MCLVCRDVDRLGLRVLFKGVFVERGAAFTKVGGNKLTIDIFMLKKILPLEKATVCHLPSMWFSGDPPFGPRLQLMVLMRVCSPL